VVCVMRSTGVGCVVSPIFGVVAMVRNHAFDTHPPLRGPCSAICPENCGAARWGPGDRVADRCRVDEVMMIQLIQV
jgi:hypothetical protein